jgi:hypothetical protein
MLAALGTENSLFSDAQDYCRRDSSFKAISSERLYKACNWGMGQFGLL